MNIDDDQEGVMDSLLEALKTGSAFSRDQRRKRDRPPRAVGGNFTFCLKEILVEHFFVEAVRSSQYIQLKVHTWVLYNITFRFHIPNRCSPPPVYSCWQRRRPIQPSAQRVRFHFPQKLLHIAGMTFPTPRRQVVTKMLGFPPAMCRCMV